MRKRIKHSKAYVYDLKTRCKAGLLTKKEKIFLFILFFPKTQALMLIIGLIYVLK